MPYLMALYMGGLYIWNGVNVINFDELIGEGLMFGGFISQYNK